MWRFTLVEDLFADLRFAFRVLRRQPAFALAAVAMLAFGIGVNATAFSWLQTIVLHPLPGVSKPNALVAVVQSEPGGTLLPLVSFPDFQDLTGLTGAFAGVVGTRTTSALMEIDGRNVWVTAGVATSNTFEVLGVRPATGRTFTAGEDVGEGGHPVAVVSDGLWRRALGADPRVVGRVVRVNRRPFTIVGILPPDFQGVSGGSRVDLWAPLSMHDAVLSFGSYTGRTFRWIRPLARLRDGVDLTQARAALALLSAQTARAFPDSNAGVSFRAFSLRDSPYGGQAALMPALQIVLAMAFGILCIVAANVSCLLLSRAAQRETEVTIRIAIGAGRFRLIRQFLAESLALGVMGGAAGLLLARWAVRVLPRLAPAGTTTFDYDFALNLETVAFAAALAVGTAVLFGLAPALGASRRDLVTALRSGSRGSSGGRHRLLGGLVVVEVALALMLLIGAGLCLRGFRQARQLDLGFDPNGVLYGSLNLVPSGYTAARGRTFDRALRDRLRSVPGIEEVAFVNTPPLGFYRTFTGAISVEGREARASESNTLPFVIASPGYFEAMRIPLVEGRGFEESDDETRPAVAIVNDTLAKRDWPGLDPIGRQFDMAVGVAPSQRFTVVGVAKTSKYNTLAEPPTPLVYVTYEQRPLASLFMNVLVRSRGRTDPVIPELRDAVHAIDPAVEPLAIMSMDDYIQPAFLTARFASMLLAILAAAAVMLASGGLWAVTSYAVSQRSQEIGIRLALGARRRDAVGLMVGRGMALVGMGLVAGLIGSVALSRLLSGFLYGVSGLDAVAFVGGPVLLCLIAFGACAVPSLRAAGVDPVTAMRAE